MGKGNIGGELGLGGLFGIKSENGGEFIGVGLGVGEGDRKRIEVGVG